MTVIYFFHCILNRITDVTINTSSLSSNLASISFSSAALYSFSNKKTIVLEEYSAMILASKLPKVLTKVSIYFAYNFSHYPKVKI